MNRKNWVPAVSSAGLLLVLVLADAAPAQSALERANADLHAANPSPEAAGASNALRAGDAWPGVRHRVPAEPLEPEGSGPDGLRPMQIVDGYVVLGYGEVRDAVSVADPMGFTPVGPDPGTALPVAMSPAIQPSACQVKVLSAVNRRFPDAHLTQANLLPADAQDRRLSRTNVNFSGTPMQLAFLSSGRYAPRRHGLLGFLVGYGPSLHIVSRPSWLDPRALVFSTTSFTAHLDSAWADHPIGVFLHLVIDVLRPKKRNPCP
jgi:hypothetical protein